MRDSSRPGSEAIAMSTGLNWSVVRKSSVLPQTMFWMPARTHSRLSRNSMSR